MSRKYIHSIFLIGIICLLFSFTVNSSCTLENYSPSACGSSQNDWTNPTNAYSQNDVNAVAQAGSSLTNEEDYYNFGFSFPSGSTILGIKVYIDAYTGNSNYGFDTKLSWNGGTSWTSTQLINGFTTSDTDYYAVVGGVSDLWGHTWTTSELSNSNFRVFFTANADVGRRIYVDHIKITIYYTIYPSEPSEFKYYIKSTDCDYINLTYQMNSYTNQVQIRYSTASYPTTISSGTYLYEGNANPYSTNVFTSGTTYYLSMWAKNNSCGDYSLTYDTLYMTTPCSNNINIIEDIVNATGETEYIYSNINGYTVYVNYTGNVTICDNTSLTVENNTRFTTGKYEKVYNDLTGWKIYLNYTGILPTFNHYENIINATGTHQHNTNNYGYTINSWSNYTSYYYIYPPELDGALVVFYDNDFNQWNITYSLPERYGEDYGWELVSLPKNEVIAKTNVRVINETNNYTWNEAVTEGIIVNVLFGWDIPSQTYNMNTSFYPYNGYWLYFYDNTYDLWVSTIGVGGCYDIIFFNFSDENISISGFVNCSNSVNNTNYTINENNWLNLASSLMLDNAQIFLFLLVFLWTYFISKYYDTRKMLFSVIQFGVCIPLLIAVALISLNYPFGYVIVLLIPSISLYISVEGILYNKKQKEKR